MVEPSRKFSGRWPRSGTLRNGTVSEAPTWEPLTDESGGFCWPTPVRADGQRGDSTCARGNPTLMGAVARTDWPTPRALPNENRQTKLTPSQLAGTHGLSLAASVNHWQTPCAAHRSGGNRSAYEGAPFRPALAAEVKIWSTPKASDADRGDCLSERGRNSPSLVSETSPEDLSQRSGPLNPAWVEALMGFPLGWTDPGPPAAESPSTPGSPRARRTRSRTAPRG